MYQQYRPRQFNILPPAVKNLLIMNGLLFLITWFFKDYRGYDLKHILGMYWWGSDHFKPYQMVTHVFMHADTMHLFLNMFTLWMFGSILENVWGTKRFLIYYFVTALGAAILHNLVRSWEIHKIIAQLDPASAQEVREAVFGYAVGASGAVYGVLMAYGMLFPNTEIHVYFLFPVKAKYFVGFLILLEIFLALKNNPSDNVAHLAHLGGMLFGFVLVKYWNKFNRNSFY